MKIREFRNELWLPLEPPDLFGFFADATNLDMLTPPWLHFHVLTPPPIEMKPGALIDYELKIHGIKVRWRTRINVWEPPHRFVDEQLRGPYQKWVHEHTFVAHEGGTKVCDLVTYATPFDFLTHRFLVRPDIEKIFAYRSRELSKRFSKRK